MVSGEQVVSAGGVAEDQMRPRAAFTERIIALDRMIHEPSRPAILTVLRHSQRVQYLVLKDLTGLSKGNFSNHLAKLEAADFVAVEKHFEGKKPVTTVVLTEPGELSIEGYWNAMERVAAESGVYSR